MDTRSKIVNPDRVPAGATVVTGTFDVIRAADTRDLADLPRPLAVVILPLASELLPARARAELAAGLRMVDYVLITDDDHPEALLASLRPAAVVRLEALHAERKKQLMEHVQRRQTS